jgi:hypothetical protein
MVTLRPVPWDIVTLETSGVSDAMSIAETVVAAQRICLLMFIFISLSYLKRLIVVMV